ncbi:Glucanase [Mycena kentingensis (nom. inval.)]|nr:Glucanase [Mycena kentingensis (nom. inval.)]
MAQSPFAHLLHTNYVPSDAECDRIRAFLTTPREDARRLSAEVVRLQALLNEAKSKHDAVYAEIAAHEALISPLRRLPDDILRAVFLCTLPQTRNVVLTPTEGPMLLSLVCRRWRDVALSTSRLWASLHIVIPGSQTTTDALRRVVKLWLSRAGAAPLSITTRLSNTRRMQPFIGTSPTLPLPDSTPFLQDLIPAARNWKRVELLLSTPDEWTLLATLRPDDTPLLQALDLRNEVSSNPMEPASDAHVTKLPLFGVPSLRSFTYYVPGGLKSLPPSIPYRTLTHLDLTLSAVTFPAVIPFPLPFLPECVTLQSLAVSLPGYNVSIEEGAAYPADLPELSRVVLGMYLTDRDFVTVGTPSPAGTLSPFDLLHAPALRTLDLADASFDISLREMLRPLPFLTRLRFRWSLRIAGLGYLVVYGVIVCNDMSGLIVLAALLPAVIGQLIGTNQAENHPPLQWATCTGTGGNSCTTQSSSVVIDANWRWTHIGASGTTNCYTGNTWDQATCGTNGTACATACAVDGADYSGTYGITTSGNALTLKFVTVSQQPNIGSRVYLMAPGSQDSYQLFKFANQEFTFDVDVSQLPCGLNGALYFAQMDADGGVSKSGGRNKAGARYGTGYCDAQCPRDIKFINGVANSVGWTPSPNDTNAGTGTMGTCCPEMDVWEANSISTAFTPHPCTIQGQSTCTGSACSAPNVTQGTCDQAGCDFNAYRMGVLNAFGPGSSNVINTQQKFTVVTQFIGNPITEIRRFYVQNGQVFANPSSAISGVTGNSLSDSFCAAQKTAFGDPNTFAQKGGMAGMSQSANAGMVLVLSIWDDHAANMLWLDAPYPPTKSPSAPGVTRGTCSPNSGAPTQVESQSPNAQVIYSNIKFGPIGSTFNQGSAQTATSGTGSGGPTSTSTGSGGTSTGGTVPEFGQCGGQNYNGPTQCVSGTNCVQLNPFFFQCLRQ